MYPATFDYVRAESLSDALAKLAELDDAKLIAGGHSLIPMMKLRLAQPGSVIDIGGLEELRGVRFEAGALRIGALTTHAALASSSDVATHAPLIAQAAAEIGDVQVRNRGTIGGNIAHADPGSDLPAALVASSAVVHVQGQSGSRSVVAADFFLDLLSTSLEENEVITAVEVPSGEDASGAYLKFEHPASGYAVIGAAALMRRKGDTVTECAVALNGLEPVPHVVDCSSLEGSEPTDEAIEAVAAAIQVEDPLGDHFASGEYRLHLARVMTRRAIVAARDA